MNYRLMKNLMNACFWMCMLLTALNLALGHFGWAFYTMAVGFYDMKVADMMEEKENASKSNDNSVQ